MSAYYGKTFVYNIGMSDSAFDQAANIYVLKSLKSHKTMKCPKEFEPVLYGNFCATQV